MLVGVSLYGIQMSQEESSREKRNTGARGTEGRTPQTRKDRGESRIRGRHRT